MSKLLSVLLIVSMVFVGCTGKTGPVGPQGPQGEPGASLRVVYQSTTPITTEEPYTVLVPEISTADMPLVSVYISLPGDDFWVELPIYVSGGPSGGTSAFIQDGKVIFFECKGFLYKIVVVR